MAIDYRRMRATATRLLTENGAEYVVTRKGGVSVIGGVEHHKDDQAFNAIGVRTDYKPSEIDGSVIINGDVRIVFTAETELQIGDLVLVDGKQYRIVEPNPVKPASLLICYRTQLRA
ncbi:hypothetical protein [Limnobaculum xujianqingii]|uniref:hypothetical protein n=1 Tax=Limnobaculum xujianqingii TaxID=2738837 RepID=UPI00112BEFAE|nr:hypothetical protein [Limnobaculum xujianqingii]